MASQAPEKMVPARWNQLLRIQVSIKGRIESLVFHSKKKILGNLTRGRRERRMKKIHPQITPRKVSWEVKQVKNKRKERTTLAMNLISPPAAVLVGSRVKERENSVIPNRKVIKEAN